MSSAIDINEIKMSSTISIIIDNFYMRYYNVSIRGDDKMALINENDILRNLKDQNRWWVTGSVDSELAPPFKRKEYSRVKNVFFNEIRRFPVLSGPRRVGKSTIVFQIIDELLKDGVNPQRILFYTLDEFPNDGTSIKEAVEIYSKFIYEKNDFYLFIDEAQKDKSWKNYVKKLFDLNKDVRVMITGSSSVELETESDESGAGRFYTIKIPTMSFYDFCIMNGKEIDVPKIDVFKMHTLPVTEQSMIIMRLGSLYPEMVRYMKNGGFPEYAKSGDYSYVSKLIRDQVVTKAIRQDIPSSFDIKNTEALANLFTFFCYNTSSIINVETLSNELNIDRTTCNNYITSLEKSNLIYLSEQLDIGGKKPLKPRRKVHISDNGIKCAVTRNNGIETNQTEFGASIETVSYKHIRDYYDQIDDDLYKVGYIRNSKGQEIDIVVQEQSANIQYVEAKNRNNSSIKDTDGIVVMGMHDVPGYIITKKAEDFGMTERGDTKLYRIPAVAFLYLISQK